MDTINHTLNTKICGERWSEPVNENYINEINTLLSQSVGKDELDQLNKWLIKNIPVHKFIGLKIFRVEKGIVEGSFSFKTELARLGSNAIHGGYILATLDHISALASRTGDFTGDRATIELKTNFIKMLRKNNSPYKVRAVIVRDGKHTVVVRGEIYSSNNELLAVSIGTWIKIRNKES